jgi:hypothetical protein
MEQEYPEYCIVTCNYDCIDTLYTFGYKSSIVLTSLTMLVALYHIFMHFINFNNPYFQSKIISTLCRYSSSYTLPAAGLLCRLHSLLNISCMV